MTQPSVDLSVIQAREAAFFAAFGSPVFASTLAQLPLLDVELAENLALNVVSDREILANASRQGDIGSTNKAQLPDSHSRKEHGSVDFEKSAATLVTIREVAEEYKKRHGIKFMVFASGKSAEEMLEILKGRIDRPSALEWAEARSVLFKIFLRRIGEVTHKYSDDDAAATTSDQASVVNAHHLMEALFKRHAIDNATATATWGSSSPSHCPQEISWNKTETEAEVVDDTSASHWHFGSASKLIATAFCLDYFATNNIPLASSVNSILESIKSSFRIKNGDAVTVEDLLFSTNASVTTTHPVIALRSSTQFPPAGTPLTNGHLLQGLIQLAVSNDNNNERDSQTSEAGLMVCQHIIQCHIKEEDDKPLAEATSEFFKKCGVSGFLYYPGEQHKEDEESVESLAFGLRGSESIAKGFHKMLLHIVTAYHDVRGSGAITHDSARKLLFSLGSDTNGSLVLLRSVSNNKFIVINGADNNGTTKYFAMQCYDGADRGKGFVVSSTSDGFNAEFASRGCCQALVFRGFDFYEAAAATSTTARRVQANHQSQREFYVDRLLRFFAPAESPSSSSSASNRKVAEEFPTSRGDVAVRFSLLGHGLNAEDSVFNATSLEFGADVVVSPLTASSFTTLDARVRYAAMCRRALNPRPPQSMFDGFLNNDHPRQETQKSEDLTISLHHPVAIHRVEIDFSLFVGHEDDNTVPDFVEIIGVTPSQQHRESGGNNNIREHEVVLVPKTAVKHFAGSVKVFEISSSALNHVQVETIVAKNYPGGGFNRIKCFAKRVFF